MFQIHYYSNKAKSAPVKGDTFAWMYITKEINLILIFQIFHLQILMYRPLNIAAWPLRPLQKTSVIQPIHQWAQKIVISTLQLPHGMQVRYITAKNWEKLLGVLVFEKIQVFKNWKKILLLLENLNSKIGWKTLQPWQIEYKKGRTFYCLPKLYFDHFFSTH